MLAAGVLLLGAATCDSPVKGAGVVCTEEARAGITLTIVDSLTGTADALTGLWARAVAGTYRDSTTMNFGNSETGTANMALAYEHAGTFVVTVHATGYQDWTKPGVVVAGDTCHVIGVALAARLVK